MRRSIFGKLLAGIVGLCLMAGTTDVEAKETSSNSELQRTLSIIKPDAVTGNHIGDVIASFENEGLHVVASKMLHLTEKQAGEFYSVHKERPFYSSLVQYMTSGPVIVQVLEGPNAVEENRRIMGATDPKKAAKNTIRARFAKNIQSNAVHGSDSVENAEKEIRFFFSNSEICPRSRQG